MLKVKSDADRLSPADSAVEFNYFGRGQIRGVDRLSPISYKQNKNINPDFILNSS